MRSDGIQRRPSHCGRRQGAWNSAARALLLGVSAAAWAQGQPREYRIGALERLEDLPPGRFRADLERLSPPARDRARQWLRSFHFTESDTPALHADANGGICYACRFPAAGEVAPADAADPPAGAAPVPVTPFPAGLVFHSRPGSANVLYIHFVGETVTNTEWNTMLGRSSIPALPFDTDGAPDTFSDAEQTAIRRIWQRMAEDFAPFDIDVTTERPAALTTRTAVALITRNTDANGQPNPYSTAGGVAYVNVFGTTTYATYRPAWIYHNNLGNTESLIAEAASHEIGHNLGLSHDGKTDGTEYYGGHGTGDISWGPIMGTGYNRNVTQWCMGEYYMSNNTQDDLATIAGKIAYRTDDHGGTAAAATPLTATGGTNILATTPETDPGNTNRANKGVLERNTDADMFSFITGAGPVHLTVAPWVSPGGTRGGNADLSISLYDNTGVLLLTNNPSAFTFATVETNLAEGRYFLLVRSSGAGEPFSATPTGYTAYGSLGQYFITGRVAEATSYVVPPTAELQATNLTQAGRTNHLIDVLYTDDLAIEAASVGDGDIRVTGPNGYDRPAAFVSLNVPGNGTPRVATYAVTPAGGGAWLPSDNGIYTVHMQAGQVRDTEGAWVPAGALGQFTVAVPWVLYTANMDADPGWTLEPQWQYGLPAYGGAGPTGGYTGAKIVAYNLSGNYGNNLSTKYATTPSFSCAGFTTITLRFRRWLRTRNNDTSSIQVSTNGTAWTTVWSTTKAVSDTRWQEMQYSLPAMVTGSPTVRIRWGLASNLSQTDIGWNLDDVEVLGGGALDTAPPTAAMHVANLTAAGSPSHACSVTYTDDTAVRLASLDSTDLLVTGPNGYTNFAELVGADLPTDGSPLTGSYAIPAPGSGWDQADNGTYTVHLTDAAVDDVLNNDTAPATLGSFEVAISPPATYELTVGVNEPAWGAVDPTGGVYEAGSVVHLQATPAPFFRFEGWTGDAEGTNNPTLLMIDTNRSVTAEFAEVATARYPTPHWWLAAHGYTNDLDNVVTNLGANGLPLWASFVAGLDPSDPDSRLELIARPMPAAQGVVLEWAAVSGRVYTVACATNLGSGFAPLPGAVDLPPATRSVTGRVDAAGAEVFYRLEVRKP